MVYSDPALWEEAKRAARERLGGHSARAMQLAGQLYRAAGGRYLGRKTKAQRSLTSWTGQDWTTKSGKPSRETGERYLPRRVIEQLTSAEYAETSRAKRKGTKQGNQYVKQPAKIAAKVARLKAQANRKENPTMKRKPTPAQIAARERFAEMARSGAFKKTRKKNPMVISKQADESLSRQGSRGYVRKLLDRYSDEGHVVSVKKTRSGSIGIAFDGGRMLTVASARKKLEDYYGITERMGRRSNPRASNPVASKLKANPVKREMMKEKRPFYYVVKIGQSYDGQFLSTHYSLDDVKKIAQQKADKYGAQAKITEFHM